MNSFQRNFFYLLAFFLVWDKFLFPFFSIFLYYTLALPWWLCQIILIIIFTILTLEILVRFLMLSNYENKSLKIISTEVSAWKKLDREELSRYTKELESLGFISLMDYTFTSASTNIMVRLLSHPKEFCFAELMHSEQNPSMACIISGYLDREWAIATLNNFENLAFHHACYRQPKVLTKRIETQSAEILTQSFLELRQQVMHDLGVEVVRDTSLEFFLEREQYYHLRNRTSLARKSITWVLLESLYFSFNRPLEWLGDYPKIKRQQSR